MNIIQALLERTLNNEKLLSIKEINMLNNTLFIRIMHQKN